MTITATRNKETLLTVPLAVTVIGKRELENRKGYSLDEVLHAVPGVFAQSRYGTSDVRLVIRGFGARGAGDRSEPAAKAQPCKWFAANGLRMKLEACQAFHSARNRLDSMG